MPLTYSDIREELASAIYGDYRATILWTRLHEKGSGYEDAYAYAIRVGTVTGNILRKYQPEDLADWDLENLIPGTLGLNHNMVVAACREAQRNLNALARIGILPQPPDFDGNRAFGLVEAVRKRGKIGSSFYDQVTNFDLNVVDQSVRKNAEFQFSAGLNPKIVRTAASKCCEWCDKLAGTYDYYKISNTGNPVWRRHDNCRCLILYNPGDGSKRRQNVHTKRWTEDDKTDRIAFAEQETQSGGYSGAKKTDNQRKKHAETYYEEVRNRKPYADAKIIASRVEGFTVDEIEDVRQHMFVREIRRDGTIKRFDPDYYQSQVWQRLTTGQPIWDSDPLMLEHERMESRIMRETGCTYEEAHEQTQEVFDWWSANVEERERRKK